MTDEEIHNIYLHMSGKAEGLVEANGTADFPVLFARAILEYDRLTKDAQNMASKSTYKEQIETKEYERGFIDGMQKQMQSSVDKAVNAMTLPTYYIPSKDQREWVGLTENQIDELEKEFIGFSVPNIYNFVQAIEAKLKERNT